MGNDQKVNVKKESSDSFWGRDYWKTDKGKDVNKYASAGINILSQGLNGIAGAHNTTGDTLNSLGDAAMMAPPPYGLIAGGVLKAAGFITNGFTNSVNEQYAKEKNAEIGGVATQISHANDYESLIADQNSFKNVELGDLDQWGSAGIFSDGSARRNARNAAASYLADASIARQNNLANTADNIGYEQTHNQLLNMAAEGGKIETDNVLLKNKEPLLSQYNMKSPKRNKSKLITRKHSYQEVSMTPEQYDTFRKNGGKADIIEDDRKSFKEGDELEFTSQEELDKWLAENNLNMDNIQIID